ncbi:c-type cytochrome [Albidovulum sp.]|uniref:c-type cytochrome n=1 Tax=Albidovulum sp. TaxID=1872424 RepID=UPI0039B8F27A
MHRLAAILVLALPAHAEVTPERAGKLEHIVIQDCGSCHGLTMKGGLGSALTPEALADAEPEGLAMIILDGVPGTAMPRWRPVLSEDDALWIADYLKGQTR